jgi:hypothetical protein
MAEHGKKTLKPLTADDFKIITAGKSDNDETSYALINETNAPMEEMVNPLIFSLDYKKHPEMQAIPAASKYSRDFKKLYDELRKEPPS